MNQVKLFTLETLLHLWMILVNGCLLISTVLPILGCVPASSASSFWRVTTSWSHLDLAMALSLQSLHQGDNLADWLLLCHCQAAANADTTTRARIVSKTAFLGLNRSLEQNRFAQVTCNRKCEGTTKTPQNNVLTNHANH